MELKELLGEELYNQVIAKAGDKHKIAIVSDGNWIPKETFNQVNEAKKKAEDDLKERDKQLDGLKKSAGDNEALKQQIETLQGENKAAREKYEADMKELRTNAALKLALTADAHDPDLVAGLIDKSKIELDDAGNVKAGLNDQIKALREGKAFLFKEQKGPKFKGATPPSGSDPDYNTSPELAELQKQYQKALDNRDIPLQISLKNQIFEMQKG